MPVTLVSPGAATVATQAIPMSCHSTGVASPRCLIQAERKNCGVPGQGGAKVSKEGLIGRSDDRCKLGTADGRHEYSSSSWYRSSAREHEQVEILPSGRQPPKAHIFYRTTSRVQSDKPVSAFNINLAITDLKTGKVVAQSSARSRDQGWTQNRRPTIATAVLVKDKVVRGPTFARARLLPEGADPAYFERIATAPLSTLQQRLQHGLSGIHSRFTTAQRAHPPVSSPGSETASI